MLFTVFSIDLLILISCYAFNGPQLILDAFMMQSCTLSIFFIIGYIFSRCPGRALCGHRWLSLLMPGILLACSFDSNPPPACAILPALLDNILHFVVTPIQISYAIVALCTIRLHRNSRWWRNTFRFTETSKVEQKLSAIPIVAEALYCLPAGLPEDRRYFCNCFANRPAYIQDRAVRGG